MSPERNKKDEAKNKSKESRKDSNGFLAGKFKFFLPRPSSVKGGKLGTFIGVFTPTILTILGVIMYLRFGWVVGHAGIIKTLLIVLLANSITLATTLSLSAVATNAKVGVGGAYYIISRSLGLEVGGAIGLPLFLSQAFSVTLYAYGLAESLRFVLPEAPLQATALMVVLAVGALSYKGAAAALKSQVPIMGLIALSLLALGFGSLQKGDFSNLTASAASGQFGFWTIFAVFFPAVTGIMAGLGLSGDLEDPKKSIPRGSLFATFAGLGIYLLIPLFLIIGSDPETLRNDPLAWAKIAPLGPMLILPGLWGAIFSSAVGSMLGAPRTLQALAMDHLAPKALSRVSEKGGEPTIGLIVSLFIALAAVFLGDLNTVAAVVTMFFLTVYGMVNLVAALESISGDPSWRPKVNTPWQLSLLGGVACLGTMMLINYTAGLIAIVLELGIWFALQRKEKQADWGDVRRGVFEALIRWALIHLSRHPMTARSWRPHILTFAERVDRSLPLVRFADWFSQNRGVVTVCELIVSNLFEVKVDPLERERELARLFAEEELFVFGEVNVVDSVGEGIVSVSQANGMAGLHSNTVMLGWPDNVEKLTTWLRVISNLEKLKKSLIIGKVADNFSLNSGPLTIDVWWGGLQRNSDLMLLLAYLLSRNAEWAESKIRVLSVASNEYAKAQTERFLEKLLPEIRINAEIEVTQKGEGASINDLIREKSSKSDVVFLGLASPDDGKETAYAVRLMEIASGLPTFFFVRNSSLFIGELVTPGAEPVVIKAALPADVEASKEKTFSEKTEKTAPG